MKLDVLGEIETAVYGGIEIPRAYEPLVCLPRCAGHNDFSFK
jgi:hypothetical protein